MSYIVVSDVHLGGKCNHTEFCEFLDWVHDLANKSKTCKDNEVLIKKPDKIILLGDILELWDPRKGDRDYVIKDCMRTFTMLSGMACDKIYVVGNHDDSLSELDTKVDCEMLPNGTKFDIYNRHYPYFSFYWDEVPGKDSDQLIDFLVKNYDVNWVRAEGIKKSADDKTISISDGKNALSLELKNERKKGFLPYLTMREYDGTLRINGSEAGKFKAKTKKVKLENGTSKKYLEASISKSLKVGNRSYFFLHGHQFDKEQAILAYVSNLIGQSWNPLGWFQDLFNITSTKKNWMKNLVIFSGLLLGGWYYLWVVSPPPGFLSTLAWAAITGFFALSSIPGVVAWAQGRIYGLTKPIDKTAEQVIEDEYYKKNKDTIEADVVVFGHTHFASYYELKSNTGKKLFINSGCWTGEDLETDNKAPDDKIRYANTFVYIDESGAYIMKWLGTGNIKCIKAFAEKRALTLAF